MKRVLKPGGIQRIVVPDLEILCKAYLSHLAICEREDPEEARGHDAYIADIIEQCVRKESHSGREQTPLRRFIENIVRGDARRRGETHQWMYDRISVEGFLVNLGYKRPTVQSYNTSAIANWNQYTLDLDECGNAYKRDSLYLEAQK